MHPSNQELQNFLHDSLSEEENLTIDQHLADCKQCRHQVELIANKVFETPDSVGNGQVVEGPDNIRSLAGAKFSPEFRQRFVLQEEIGQGGMGFVCRGFDRELNREIAIKISKGSESDALAVRFYREAQITAQLQHPGIVPVHHAGRMDDGRRFIAMKLVKGNTLQQLLESDDDRQQVTYFKVFEDICNAMAYSHSREIVHRDLKPDNVMVGEFGEVQIMDWGLAKKLNAASQLQSSNCLDESADLNCDEVVARSEASTVSSNGNMPTETASGEVFGTPAYMSPEQSRGESVDKRTDVFAIGGILYQILTGKAPFDAPTATIAISKSIENDLADAFARLDAAECDAELGEIAKHCLAANVDERPADAAELKRMFGEYIDGRESRLQAAKLEKARANERLAAQQIRHRQIVRFGTAIFAMLLVAALAGLLYLNEKNARIADQAKLEREQLQQKTRQENELRNVLAGANKHKAIAEVQEPELQNEQWVLALKEVEKASSIVSEQMDAGLRSEFHKLRDVVVSKQAMAARAKNNHQADAVCSQAVLLGCEISYYPEDLRICCPTEPAVSRQIEEAFAKIGVVPGDTASDVVKRIAGSKYKTQLIQGMIGWQRELSIDAMLPGAMRVATEEQIDFTEDWLIEFLNRVDPDPFRTKIRNLGRDVSANRHELRELLAQEEAVGNRLTIHSIAIMLQTIFDDAEQRVDYLRRAYQNFPQDFLINWYLPAMSGRQIQQQVRTQYALSCYSLRPDNPAVLAALGIALTREQKYERAIEVLIKLVKLAPEYYPGYLNLSMACGKAGLLSDANVYYHKGNHLKRVAADKFLMRARNYRRIGRIAKADLFERMFADQFRIKAISKANKSSNAIARIAESIESLVAEIKAEPTHAHFHAQLKNLYQSLCRAQRAQGDPRLAEKTLQAAILQFEELAELAPGISAAHENLFRLCEQQCDFREAIKALNRAIEIHPSYPPYQGNLEKLYLALCNSLKKSKNGKQINEVVDSAIENFNQIAERAPGLATPHECLSRLCEKQGRIEPAIEALQNAIAIHPDYKPHRIRLGDLYVSLHKALKSAGESELADQARDAAVATFTSFADQFPTEATPHERLADIFHQQGEFQKAIDARVSAIGIQPNHQPHQVRLVGQLYTFAKFCKAKEDWEIGKQVLSENFKLLDGYSPDHPRTILVLDFQAQFHEALEQYQEAVELLRHALEIDSTRYALKTRLAMLYHKLKQIELADSTVEGMLEEHAEQTAAIEFVASYYLNLKKQPGKTEALIRRSIGNGVDSPTLQKYLAQALMRQGSPEKQAEAREIAEQLSDKSSS